ncbi:diversity-generating retroelement protein Avd [Tissierella carlieri]|uniref:Diversity-generating retroelement protein Avd n=1 Tax=Tissierella carlieri TaxID=689904 RepID=A0ABT1SC58_9FIRM|nr:diversity-generating retroelement protein Avd [Tissierella carlieri]MCQ4924072.1 diversity-generating retroelement protein Avd [Tissierella carlieri]
MQPLALEKKTETLLNEIVYPLLKNFPQAEKYCLCQEIKQAFYRIIRNVMIYSSLKDGRLQYLKQVDSDLKLLLVLFGVAREQKYITEKKAHELQNKISELGRMTGGLIKNCTAQTPIRR